jgi:brefeldin A-resistance guanine nucleotide exchange factor 1
MTLQEYCKNLRGSNDKSDFDGGYLKLIYDSIKQHAFTLADDHSISTGFDYIYQSMLDDIEFMPSMIAHTGRNTSHYDKTWLIEYYSLLKMVIMYAMQHDDDVGKGLTAMQQLVLLASYYGRNEMVTELVSGLCGNAGVLATYDQLPAEINVLEVKNAERKPNRWIADIGRSSRNVVQLVFAFNIAADFADDLDWRVLGMVLGNLFLHQVLPTELLCGDHYCLNKVMLPRLTPLTMKSEEKVAKVGILNKFAQFLSITSEEEPWAQYYQEYYEQVVSAMKFCKIEELLSESRFIRDERLQSMLQDFVDLCYEERQEEKRRGFSSAALFYIEIIFRVIVVNRDRLVSIWPILDRLFVDVIQPGVQPILIERVATNLLRLVQRLSHNDEMQSLVFEPLQRVSNLGTDVVMSIAEHLMAGFVAVGQTDMTMLSKNSVRWSTLMRVLSVSATHPLAASNSFELTSLMIAGHPESPVTAEHFGECVDLLISFSAGVYGVNNVKSPLSKHSEVNNPTRL